MIVTYVPFESDLSGKVAVVTGANSGMGKQTACELARMGARVVLACRSTERGEAARREIAAATGSQEVSVMEVDLASLASVRSFAGSFGDRTQQLDVLVNNAAASLGTREVTTEGFERHWAVNVLGPYLLTTLLLPALEASGSGRIVTVSTRPAGGLDLSDTQYERRRFSGTGAYRASKQASRMLTWALAAQLDARSVTANAVNPGYVTTELTKSTGGLLGALMLVTKRWSETPLDGADTTIWLAASPDVAGVTGRFWNKRRELKCRYRDAAQIHALESLVEQQLHRLSRPADRERDLLGRFFVFPRRRSHAVTVSGSLPRRRCRRQ